MLYEVITAFLSVLCSIWKLIVTIRPPLTIPQAKSGGDIRKPAIVANRKTTQFAMVTNFRSRP